MTSTGWECSPQEGIQEKKEKDAVSLLCSTMMNEEKGTQSVQPESANTWFRNLYVFSVITKFKPE